MPDFRELYAVWNATRTPRSRLTYAQALRETADFRSLARFYSPILEHEFSTELREEYLELSPLQPHARGTLTHLLGLCVFSPVWMIEPALTTGRTLDLVVSTIAPETLPEGVGPGQQFGLAYGLLRNFGIECAYKEEQPHFTERTAYFEGPFRDTPVRARFGPQLPAQALLRVRVK